MSSGYELRYQLLRDARDMLYEQWRADRETSFREHDVSGKKVKIQIPAAPTVGNIVDLANQLYDFVKKKD